ncbi:hypothetical protein [Streptomyces sp. SID12501]|uniref:Uncharacterized protein n=1 Tax=Streptomyces sp. SID12501 TaxID=2706042 RepID=A0A6B3BTU4_9ACTN|nr:hypothetical protein [Streptomyces sp. SID12501]NEC87722.1 hypothetical protein [Streptomyces sp. SID12501]
MRRAFLLFIIPCTVLVAVFGSAAVIPEATGTGTVAEATTTTTAPDSWGWD